MRIFFTIFMICLAACAQTRSGPVIETYSILLKEDRQTWCAYKNSDEFHAEVAKLKPIESARITYAGNKFVELTYQIEAESGDWIVIDKYTPMNGGIVLRRANLFAQENLQVIQEATIRWDMADPFRVISVSTLDGKIAELTNVDFPAIPVRTNPLAAPFMQIVTEMRSRSLGKLCKKVKDLR